MLSKHFIFYDLNWLEQLEARYGGFSNKSTKLSFLKKTTAHGKKTYGPWKWHGFYRDYFSLFAIRSRIMGKIVPLIFMDFSRAGGFFAT